MNLMRRKRAEPHPLFGRRLYIPRMSTGGAETMAAAFRSLGVTAEVSPESDDRTLELAARFTSGEECLPQRVTLGNFLKVITREDFDPSKNAFFLPTSSGPCRFGQYAPFLRKVLRELDCGDAFVLSPTSSDGYDDIASHVIRFKRTAWRAILVSDILRKLLLMFRPYEKTAGETDQVHDEALKKVCAVLADGSLSLRVQMEWLVGRLEEIRDGFLGIALAEVLSSRPLVGVVGEIYLRLNDFSNQQIVRRIEALGGEVWMADISEWVWYTNCEQERKLREAGRRMSPSMAGAKLRRWLQKRDEGRLLVVFEEMFARRKEMSVERLLTYSKPYLPAHMALGEMTLNTGKAVAFFRAGCDGVVDVSPFTCMNGIVTETVYPRVSKDHDDMPIRIFYFDGVPFDLDSDLEIFMEMVKSYRRKRLVRG